MTGDRLTAGRAYRFAAENGYDLGDYANREDCFRLVGITWSGEFADIENA